jgi:hypothetical protein
VGTRYERRRFIIRSGTEMALDEPASTHVLTSDAEGSTAGVPAEIVVLSFPAFETEDQNDQLESKKPISTKHEDLPSSSVGPISTHHA